MSGIRMIRALALGLAGVTLILGGVAVASNMGFKFVPNFGANQTYTLSLPWNNNYTAAQGLINDLEPPASVNTGAGQTRSEVCQIETNGGLTCWSYGSPPANNFGVDKGEGFRFNIGTNGITASVVVGSHDPNFLITIPANQAFGLSIPYHGTLGTAQTLVNDMEPPASINTGAGQTRTEVCEFDTAATLTCWSYGSPPANNFAINLGQAVRVNAGSNGITNYPYPHY